MQRASLAILAVLAALPAAAQERGGVSLRSNPVSELNAIDANRGCPLSATSVTVGLNKATGTGSSALQQLGTFGGSGMSGCRPLVSTQVVAGANLALGNGSSAGQSIAAKGPSGVLATTTFTRGVNIGFGAGSTANQRLFNQTGR
jgi:hypothetical protein